MARRLTPSIRSSRSLSTRKSLSRQKVTVIPRKTTRINPSLPQTRPVESPPPTLTVIAKPVEPRRSGSSRPKNPALTIFFYILRLGIMGVAIAAIAGTLLPLFNPIRFFDALNLPLATPSKPSPETPKPSPVVSPASVELSKELTPLKDKLTAVAAKYEKLQPQAFFLDMDNGNYVNLGGELPIAAASTLKVPILVAFFQDVDAGKIHLDEKLTADQAVIASGSGDMQYQGVGKQYSALEVATKMIIISDNTATNMLIRRLGGKEVLNQRFKEWGLSSTVINNLLPDLEGTNITSSQDLGLLLAKVSQGELVSLKSRDRLLGIMAETKTRTLLPQGLEETAKISHKTGDIGSVLGDVGVIDIPNGKRYIAAVLTKRPHNDEAGRKLIQEFSRTAYQHFKWYAVLPLSNTPTYTVSPSPTSIISPSPTATVSPTSPPLTPSSISSPSPRPTLSPSPSPRVNTSPVQGSVHPD